jgi:three-Cys-motif partner protein
MQTHPVRPGDPHTAVKNEVLVRYLDVWAPTVLRSARRATYAEAYAGSDLDTGEGNGSAVAALRVFGEFVDHMKGRQLTMILLEEDQERLSTLADRLAAAHAELDDPPELHPQVVAGACSQLVPALTRTGAFGGPILAYLDSVGAAPPPFDAIAAVAAERSGELLIGLDPGMLAQLGTGRLPAETGDRLFGGAAWRAVAEQPDDRRYPYLVDCYRAALRGAGASSVAHVELVADDGTAELLVFATRAPKQLERFKEELWAVDEYAGVRYRDPRDSEHTVLDISLKPNVAPLRRALLDTVTERGECTVAELRRHTLAETPYRAADATPALATLLTAGTLTRQPNEGRVTADTVIRPGRA